MKDVGGGLALLNRLMQQYPDLPRGEAGQLATMTRQYAQAGDLLEAGGPSDLTPPGVVPLNPYLAAMAPIGARYRYNALVRFVDADSGIEVFRRVIFYEATELSLQDASNTAVAISNQIIVADTHKGGGGGDEVWQVATVDFEGIEKIF